MVSNSLGPTAGPVQFGKSVDKSVVSNSFYVHPYLGKIPILTSIFFKWAETTKQFWMKYHFSHNHGSGKVTPNETKRHYWRDPFFTEPWLGEVTYPLLGTNMSPPKGTFEHFWRLFSFPFLWDMLVPGRVMNLKKWKQKSLTQIMMGFKFSNNLF